MKLTSEMLREVIADELTRLGEAKGKPKLPKSGRHAMKKRGKPSSASKSGKSKDTAEPMGEGSMSQRSAEMRANACIEDAKVALQHIDELKVALHRLASSSARDMIQDDMYEIANLGELQKAVADIVHAHMTLEEHGWTVS